MRRPAAREALLPAAAAGLVFAALFLSSGSSESRLFWIGAAAVLVAAVGWIVAPPRVSFQGGLFFAGLGAFVLWQGASIAWSIQPARSWDYTNRGLVYFAFAAVGALLGGVAPRRFALAGSVLLGALLAWALVAKVIPGLDRDYGRLARLRYPLGYWNELALLAAASVPLGLWLLRRVRLGGTLLLYAALVVAVLTYSRVGIVLTVAAAVAWLWLDRDRLEASGPLGAAWIAGAAVAGAGLLLPGVSSDFQPHDVRLQDGLVFGPALIAGAVATFLVLRLVVTRAVDRRVARGVAVVMVALFLAALAGAVVHSGGPADFARDRWHEFANPVGAQVANNQGRLISTSSSNRWRWWQEAWNAFVDHPAQGSGAGTFGLIDRNERNTSLAVVEPHSSVLQDLSETGVVGFLLVVVFVGAAVSAIFRRERDRAVTALGLGVVICIVHSLVDIDWDFVAVQGPLFLTVGTLVSGPGVAMPARSRRRLFGATVGVCALAALYSLASPWLAGRSLDSAWTDLAHLRLVAARDEAKNAHSLNPLAVEPYWVWALTVPDDEALALYRRARDLEPRNPETWFQLGAFELDILQRPRDAYRDLNQSYTLDRYGPAGERGGKLDQARCLVDPATCP